MWTFWSVLQWVINWWSSFRHQTDPGSSCWGPSCVTWMASLFLSEPHHPPERALLPPSRCSSHGSDAADHHTDMKDTPNETICIPWIDKRVNQMHSELCLNIYWHKQMTFAIVCGRSWVCGAAAESTVVNLFGSWIFDRHSVFTQCWQ